MSATYAPRYRVTLNGTPLLGVMSVKMRPARAFNCGTFSFTKAFVAGDAFPLAWWAGTATKTMRVQIDVALNDPGYSTVLVGNVDTYSYDAINNTISANGRDLAALLIDALTSTAYKNLTASEIVTQLATAQGLAANVTATKTIAGQQSNIDTDQSQGGIFSRAVNQWDLVCLLGQKEGIIPYVLGNTLYFNPLPVPPTYFSITASRDSAGVLTSNATRLMFDRHLTAARDVRVTVQSWNAKQKRLIKGEAITKTVKQPEGEAVPPIPYTFEHDNLTQKQADALAQQLALDISRHERVMQATIGATLMLTPQTAIKVSGTGTDYDQVYYPESIDINLDFAGGMTTQIAAKMSSPLGLYDGGTGAQVGSQ